MVFVLSFAGLLQIFFGGLLVLLGPDAVAILLVGFGFLTVGLAAIVYQLEELRMVEVEHLRHVQLEGSQP